LVSLHLSDSFCLGLEALLGAPQCTTLLLTRHKEMLSLIVGLQDKLLFGKNEKQDRKYDTVDKTVQTCRRPDVLKFWLMWKMWGTRGLRDKVEQCVGSSSMASQDESLQSSIKTVWRKMMRSFAPSNVYRNLQIYLRLFIARRKKSHLVESVFNLIQEKKHRICRRNEQRLESI
jgi:hypothetical protein